jgi:hypothetical protein
MHPRAWIAAPLTLLALVVAGCGSSAASTTRAGSIPDGASQVSAKVQAFASFDTSFGDQWNAFVALAGRFPGRGEVIDSVNASLAKHGLDFDKDVKQTIGPELDIAAWNLSAKDGPAYVALTVPQDKAGFEATLKKGSLVYYEDGDWVIFSDDQSDLDAFKALGGGTLADSSSFQDAFHALSGSALGRVYVDVHDLPAASLAKVQHLVGSAAKPVWAAADVEALADGFRADGVVRATGLSVDNFKATLFDDVPAGSFLALVFGGTGATSLTAQLDALQNDPQAAATVKEIESATGVPLGDLAAAVHGQGVLYARPAAPIPELTLVVDPGDPAALTTLTAIARHLQPTLHAAPQKTTVGGKPVWELNVGLGIAVYYGIVDGKLVVTTSQSAITDLGSGSKLADADVFKAAAKNANLSTDETAGFAYVDSQDALATITPLLSLLGQDVPELSDPNLANLRQIVVNTHADDATTARVTLFAGVEPGKPVPETHTTTTS